MACRFYSFSNAQRHSRHDESSAAFALEVAAKSAALPARFVYYLDQSTNSQGRWGGAKTRRVRRYGQAMMPARLVYYETVSSSANSWVRMHVPHAAWGQRTNSQGRWGGAKAGRIRRYGLSCFQPSVQLGLDVVPVKPHHASNIVTCLRYRLRNRQRPRTTKSACGLRMACSVCARGVCCQCRSEQLAPRYHHGTLATRYYVTMVPRCHPWDHGAIASGTRVPPRCHGTMLP